MRVYIRHLNKRSLIKGIFALLVVTLATVLWAKQMYKWQDKDGIWHYSSTPPTDGSQAVSRPVYTEPEKRVTMRKTGSDHAPEYIFTNGFHGPIQLEIQLTEANNVVSTPELPKRFTLRANQEAKLVTIKGKDQRKAWSYRLKYAWIPGPPNPRHQPGIGYLPPFGKGQRFYISQGFHGGSTHNDPGNLYAVDIVMPIGTPILAARGGVVMDVEDDFYRAGTDRKYAERANHVRILHDDGTMAIYAHLDLDSVIVRNGQRVAAGTMIAKSGNTGLSSGPHLHFAIQHNSGMDLVSIPFTFVSRRGDSVTPDKPMMLHGVIASP